MAKAKLTKVPKLLVVESLDVPKLPSPLELTDVRVRIDLEDASHLDLPTKAQLRAGLLCTIDYHAANHTYVFTSEMLSEIASDIGLALYDMQRFYLEDVQANTFVVTSDGEQKPWQEATTRMREFTDPPNLTVADLQGSNYTSNGLVWEVVSGFAGRVPIDDPTEANKDTKTLQDATLVLIADERGQIVRQHITASELAVGDLKQTLLEAIIYPMSLASMDDKQARIPVKLVCQEDALHGLLAGALNELDMNIDLVHAPTPSANNLRTQLQLAVGVSPPLLAGVTPAELSAFLEVSNHLFKEAFWERFAGNRYLGVKLDDDPWRYFNVMGQMGESFGLVYFEDWLELCKLVHDQPSMMDMVSMMMEGGPDTGRQQEAVSLIPLASLHPDDLRTLEAVDDVARYYITDDYITDDVSTAAKADDNDLASLLGSLDLGEMGLPDGLLLDRAALDSLAAQDTGSQNVGEQLPLPAQMSMQGIAPARFPLASYTVVLNALEQILSKRRSKVLSSIKQKLELDGHTVILRYPAKGNEALVAPSKTTQPDVIPGTYRLTVDVTNTSSDGYGYNYDFSKVVIEASGDASANQVIKALSSNINYGGGFEGFVVADSIDADSPSASEHVDDTQSTPATPPDSPENAMAMLLAKRDEMSVTQIWSRRDTYGPKAFVAQLAALAEQQPMFLSKWLNYYPVTFERISDDTRPKDDVIHVSTIK